MHRFVARCCRNPYLAQDLDRYLNMSLRIWRLTWDRLPPLKERVRSTASCSTPSAWGEPERARSCGGGARARVRRGDAGRPVTERLLEQAPGHWLEGRRLLLKREDDHELGAFKWRGALPVIEQYRDAGHAGVVTASTGNHGAATAWAASRTGMAATVFVPERASDAKVSLLRRLGAELVVGGADLDAAKAAGVEHARARGLPFFEDGAEPAQYRGYGGIADEILESVAPDAVVVPVGNGALLAGSGCGWRSGRRPPAGSASPPLARR